MVNIINPQVPCRKAHFNHNTHGLSNISCITFHSTHHFTVGMIMIKNALLQYFGVIEPSLGVLQYIGYTYHHSRMFKP